MDNLNNQMEVRVLGEDSIDEQVAVFMSSFNSNISFNKVKDAWLNKHYKNPLGHSYIFGVYDGDTLVSENAYLPLKYSYNGRQIDAIQSCDSGTKPEYRGKGLWSQVVNFAVNYFKEQGKYKFLIGFPNYNTSYPIFMRMKWRHVSNMSNFIMICNSQNFLKCCTKIKIPFSKLLELQRIKVFMQGKNFYECPVSTLDEQKCYDIFRLECDEPFRNWKISYKKIYSFGLSTKDGCCIATCNYIYSHYNAIPMIYLLDVTRSENASATQIYGACIRLLRKRHPDVAFIRAWASEDSETAKQYKKLLFMKSNHKNPFIIYPIEANSKNNEILLNPKSWQNLSFWDLD